jgi:hypothetical protein
MSVSTAAVARKWHNRRAFSASLARIRGYLASDATRAIQSALGLFWVIDGAVQLLPFASPPDNAGLLDGQPRWVASSLAWVAGLDGPALSGGGWASPSAWSSPAPPARSPARPAPPC